MSQPIIDAIGLEIETESITQRLANEFVQNNSTLRNTWRIDHDASIESTYKIDRKTHLILDEEERDENDSSCDNNIKGVEFVSRILMTTDNYKQYVDPLFQFLLENDEEESGHRAGIHVHVSYSYNLSILKSLIRNARYYEALFYYLGAFGKESRGLHNDFIYYRPMTKFGPQIIPYGSNYCQVYNIEDLLKSTSCSEFFFKYGGLYLDNPDNKYTPVRYSWLSLYPLLTYGTVEFRVFNKTLNSDYIFIIIDICQKFLKYCLEDNKKHKEENSIFDTSKEKVLELFQEFSYELKLDNFSKKLGNFIISNTPEVSIDKKYVLSHLACGGFTGNNLDKYYNNSMAEELEYKPKVFCSNDFIKPTFEIHRRH